MAQDIGYDHAAGPSVTLLSSDLTDGSQSAWTSSVDFGSPAPLRFGYELILTTLTSAASIVELQIAWSHDNSTFSDDNNPEIIGTILCTASTDVELVSDFVIRARYAKFRLNNQSGGTIDGTASNTALVLTDVFGNQV